MARVAESAMLAAVLLSVLTACQAQEKTSCSDKDGLAVLKNLVVENITTLLKERDIASLSEVRATVNQLPLSIANMRTVKTDPSSTKVFCEADLVMTLPVEMVQKVADNLKNEGSDLEGLLDTFRFKPSSSSANSYEAAISYSLQPTDDRKQIFAYLEEGQEHLSAGPEAVLAWSLFKPQASSRQAELPEDTSYENEPAPELGFDEPVPAARPKSTVRKQGADGGANVQLVDEPQFEMKMEAPDERPLKMELN